ncbi:MAG: VCBS repeat-containing protein, partial [Candidatus Eisenbacteria bacterium]|nr:VCBS repeat-containing protein [Candidatus Eisenbacteria bacterium]
MKAGLRASYFLGMVIVMAAWAVSARADGIQFEEVSGAAGIGYVGPSWGSAWGNYNGDLYPDLWLVDHWNRPGLYVNQGNGCFVDVVFQIIPAEFYGNDTHGATWVDYDNDGDQDLYHLADFDPESYLPLRDFFFINNEGQMDESADSLGLKYPLGRGRMPLWVDYDRDGLLDAFRPTSQRPGSADGPTVLFRHGPYGFTDVSEQVGLEQSEDGNEFALLADLSGDGRLELITHVTGPFPEKVYEMTDVPFEDIREDLGIPTNSWVNDAVAGDFDGDLDNDLFMIRGEKEEGFLQVDGNTVEVAFLAAHPVEMGVGFETAGEVTIDLYPKWKYGLDKIFIGAGGCHPEDFCFTLSPADTNVCGVCEHEPGAELAVYVGYDSCSQCWQILHSQMAINLVVTSTESIFALSAIGWDPEAPPLSDHYLVNLGDGFEDRTVSAGFLEPSSGRGVLSGDFDNDMDLDLYIVSTGPVENAPNILYRNDGGGSFHK